MAGAINARRTVLAALLGVLVAGTLPAAAQDPKVSEARRTALEWLALTDAGNGDASWNEASKKFQGSMTAAQWTEGLQKARAPYGAVEQRTFVSAQASNQFPGAPEGEYAVITFMTAFANKRGVGETLSMEREADGKWRVVGYSIR
jgi:hypothetical protein